MVAGTDGLLQLAQAGGVLVLARPAPGQTISLDAGLYALFDLRPVAGSWQSLQRSGDTLRILFDDGATIELVDFFRTTALDDRLVQIDDTTYFTPDSLPLAYVVVAENRAADSGGTDGGAYFVPTPDAEPLGLALLLPTEAGLLSNDPPPDLAGAGDVFDSDDDDPSPPPDPIPPEPPDPPDNIPPVANPVDLGTVQEDGSIVISEADILAGVTDPDGPSLMITSLTIASGSGMLVDNGDGTWTYTPAPGDDTDVTFNYTVSDGTDSDSSTASLDITPVNDQPVVAQPIPDQSSPEDTALTFTVPPGSFADPDGDPLTYSATLGNGDPLPSWLVFDPATQTFSGTPPQDFDGDLEIIVTASDGTDTVSDTFVLDITPVNDAPVASPVVLAAMAEDGTRTITEAELLAGVTDIDGPALTITALTLTSGNGSLLDNGDGTWTYTPPLNDDTLAAFSYTASDGTASASSTASLDITPVNDAPVSTPVVLAAMAEDGTRTITEAELLAGVTDIDGPALTITALTLTSGSGSLIDNGDGTWTYTPALNDDTAATFNYTASDGTDSAGSTASLDITPVNDAPSVRDETNTTDEDTPLDVPAAGLLSPAPVDVDGDPLTLTQFTVAGDATIYAAGTTAVIAGVGSITINVDGSYRFIPEPDFNGPVPVATYTVSDGTLTDEGTLTLTVNPINDAPVADDETNATNEDAPLNVAGPGVLDGDIDADLDTLTVTQFTVAGDATIYAAGSAAVIAGVGSLTINADGSYSFVPAPDFNGAVPIATYTVSDGTFTDEGTLALTVDPINDAPVAIPVDLGTVAEDGSRIITEAELLAGVTDVDGPALTITALTLTSGNGSLVDNGDGTWTYTPALNDDTAAGFSYTASDGTDSASSTASLDITPVNDSPVASPVVLAPFAEDSGPRVITEAELLAGVTDPDGPSLTVTSLTIASGDGSLVDNGDGTWSYTPALNDETAVSFSYTVSDGTDTDSSTAFLEILPVNDPPVANPLVLAPIAEDSGPRLITQDNLLAGVADPDGPSLTVTSLSIASGNGSLVNNGDGTWNYTPAQDDDTEVVFNYTVTDGIAAPVSSTASLDIAPVNDAPVATPVVLAAMAEDGTRTITEAELLAGVTDVDGPALTITALTLTSGNGSLVDNGDGTWTYTSVLNDDTVATFNYTVSDGTDTASSTASLDITPVNDAPVATPVVLAAMVEDGSRIIAEAELLAGVTDVDGPELTVTALTLTSGNGALVDNGDGTWTYSPGLNDDTVAAFSYTASDGTDSASSTASLDITPVNDSPVASPIVLTSIAEDSGARLITEAELLAGVSDVDGPALTITALTLTSGNGSLVDNGDGTWTYTPGLNDDTAAAFSYTASDGTASASSTATLDITPVNDAPVANPVNLGTVAEDGTRTITETELLAGVTDVDGPALTITALTLTGGNGSLLDNGDGTWTYTPALNDDTAAGFSYTASDGTDSASSTASLDITPVNDAPVASPVVLAAMAEDGTRTITEAELLAGVTDVDGPALTITALTLTSGNGSLIDNGDGTWTYTPVLNDDTTATFNYTASDGTDTASSTASLDITPVNDAPVATPVALAPMAEDGTRTITEAELLAGVTDVDGPALTITALTLTSGNGSLIDNGDGTWTYTPAFNDDTTATFNYTASDGTDSASSTASLDITPVNDAPVAAPVVLAAMAEDGTRTITEAELLAGVTDIDGPALTITALTLTSGNGSLIDNGDGTWTYTPALNDDTAATFNYTASDGTDSAGSTASLDITPVNDAPVADDEIDATDEDTPLNIAAAGVLIGDVDPDLDTLSVTQFAVAGDATIYAAGATAAIAGVGSLTINANGSYSFVPVLDFNGAVPLATYTVSDGTLTDEGTLTLTVNPINDAPLAAHDDNAGDPVVEAGVNPGNTPFVGDPSASGNVLANDTDVDTGDTLTIAEINREVTAVGQAFVSAHGTFTLAADGTWTYLLENDNPEIDALAQGASAIETFEYTVSDGAGGTATATLTVTITGTNDAPIAVADDNNGDNVIRGTPSDPTATGNVLANDFDVDTGDTKTVIEVNGSAANVGQQIVGIYGALTLAADGTWTYILDETDPDTLLLAATDSAVDSFTYTMADANGAMSSTELNVTVTGGDDPPYINTSSTHRFATPSQVGEIVFINGFSFQDIDSFGQVTVTIASSNPADILSAGAGGGVAVSSPASSLTLTGTIAAINAFVAANNIRWDPALGNFDRNFTFTIDDNGSLAGGMVMTKAVLFQHLPLTFNAFSADHPNLAGWNINSDDVHLGQFFGDDSVVTAWSHGPSTNNVEYNGGFAGSDTITLLFTPAQLEAILADPASRAELQDYLDGSVGSGTADNTTLSLGDTIWNATASGFENASLALATGPEGFAAFGAISANLPDFDTTPDATDDTTVGTAAADTISGLVGNDILAGLDGGDTLNGDGGADMLLGGAGADTLAGGVGNDILSGGTGADRFVLAETGAADGATIVDYSFIDGDTLDLSSLLDAAFDIGEPVSEFVRGVQSGSNILVQVDVDGGGDNFADIATLTGYGTSSPDIVRVTFEGADQVLLV